MSRESTEADVRLTALESTLAHYQRDFDQLNQVVVEQATELDQLRRRVSQLESALQSALQQLPQQGSVAEEKPPHY